MFPTQSPFSFSYHIFDPLYPLHPLPTPLYLNHHTPIHPNKIQAGDHIRYELPHSGHPSGTTAFEYVADRDGLQHEKDGTHYLLHRPEPKSTIAPRIGWLDRSPAMVWEITSESPERERSGMFAGTTTDTLYETMIVSDDPHEQGMMLERVEGKAERVLKGRFTDAVLVPKHEWNQFVNCVESDNEDIDTANQITLELADQLVTAVRRMNRDNQ